MMGWGAISLCAKGFTISSLVCFDNASFIILAIHAYCAMSGPSQRLVQGQQKRTGIPQRAHSERSWVKTLCYWGSKFQHVFCQEIQIIMQGLPPLGASAYWGIHRENVYYCSSMASVGRCLSQACYHGWLHLLASVLPGRYLFSSM